MICFECKLSIGGTSYLQVDTHGLHWGCVRDIVRRYIRDCEDRDQHTDQQAERLAEKLDFKPYEE